MSRSSSGELTQETEDAIVTRILQRLAEKGLYHDVMGELSPEDRAGVEACEQRHAARRRALGEPGW